MLPDFFFVFIFILSFSFCFDVYSCFPHPFGWGCWILDKCYSCFPSHPPLRTRARTVGLSLGADIEFDNVGTDCRLPRVSLEALRGSGCSIRSMLSNIAKLRSGRCLLPFQVCRNCTFYFIVRERCGVCHVLATCTSIAWASQCWFPCCSPALLPATVHQCSFPCWHFSYLLTLFWVSMLVSIFSRVDLLGGAFFSRPSMWVVAFFLLLLLWSGAPFLRLPFGVVLLLPLLSFGWWCCHHLLFWVVLLSPMWILFLSAPKGGGGRHQHPKQGGVQAPPLTRTRGGGRHQTQAHNTIPQHSTWRHAQSHYHCIFLDRTSSKK